MGAVTISPKFQIVIPREVRLKLSLRPGQRVEVFAFDGRIELVPVKHASELRGYLKGIEVVVDRDGDRP